MAAPLIVAGAKIAGKAIAKKIAAKQVAKVAAKKAAEGVAKKTAQKVGTEVAKKGAKNIAIKRPAGNLAQKYKQGKNINDKIQRAQDLKDSLTPDDQQEDAPQQPIQKPNFLDRVLSKGQTSSSKDPKEATPKKFDYRNTFNDKAQSKNENSQPVPTQNKGWYHAAMFMSIWKDAVEIGLNLLALGWLAPILSFIPTIALTFILFASGKKSTIKIITYFLAIVIDLLFPGVNALPITTLATFIVFHIKPEALNKLNKGDPNKGIEIIKKFIKLK